MKRKFRRIVRCIKEYTKCSFSSIRFECNMHTDNDSEELYAAYKNNPPKWTSDNISVNDLINELLSLDWISKEQANLLLNIK